MPGRSRRLSFSTDAGSKTHLDWPPLPSLKLESHFVVAEGTSSSSFDHRTPYQPPKEATMNLMPYIGMTYWLSANG